MFFGPLELARLALVRADIVDATARTFRRFEAANPGFHCYVIRGYSTEAEQAQTYADSLAQGFRASPANLSYHPKGAAVDIGIINPDGTTRVHDDARVDQADPLYQSLADCAKAEGLDAGYYFTSHPDKPDPYHLQARESFDVVSAKWAALTKERLWRAVGAGVALVILWLAWRAVHSHSKRRTS